MAAREPTVALVLAGGGARGAYEVGALSALLPALERRGERPRIVIGTSVGALNAAYFAATAHEPVEAALERGRRIWSELRWGDVLRPLASPRELPQLARGIAGLAGPGGLGLRGLLDPAPLAATLARSIDFPQVERNVASGALASAGVVATAAASSRSVVFHDGGASPPLDEGRGIEYVGARLRVDHVRASAAIPAIFPAVHVATPEVARGWYFDGGTRLNTPIKPALALGADRVVVVALNSLAPARAAIAGELRPDVVDGAKQLVQAVLVDPLREDVETLATVNAGIGRRATDAAGHRRIPYIVVAPHARESIGQVALRVFRECYGGVRGVARSPDLALLGRVLGAGSTASRGELYSYLFFAREFARELLALGAADAERWLSRRHDDGPWQVRPLTAGAR